ATTDLHRVANARKATAGQYQGLLDPAILERKRGEDERLKAKIADVPAMVCIEAKRGENRIAAAQTELATFEREWALLERGAAFASELFTLARHLVRLAAEREKPNAERLKEYGDARLESLKLELFSPAPIHRELEQAKLAQSLAFLAENLGGNHPLVEKVFAGRSPAARATELVQGTTLVNVDERKRLADGGRQAVEASDDPMIR